MTDAQIAAYIENSLRQQDEARGAYFEARMEYARDLGRGTATREKRERVEALKNAYYACA